MSSCSIDDLLRCHPSDDPAVIEAIVTEYRAPVYRLACALLDDPAEADDATQETFIAAALHIERYQPGTNFRAWLLTITANACKGRLRKRKVRRNLENLLSGLHLLQDPPPDPESAALHHERGAQLWQAVGELDEKYRLVLVLRLVQELPVSEIAQVLGINEKTIYTRLYEATRKLRRRLAVPQNANGAGQERIP